MAYYLTVLFIFFNTFAFSQSRTINGTVKDADGFPIQSALIETNTQSSYTFTDTTGYFSLQLSNSQDSILLIKSVGYSVQYIAITPNQNQYNISLKSDGRTAYEVIVKGEKTIDNDRLNVGGISINPELSQQFASPFGDFNKVLSSVGMGVSSNNELSSNYNVRGGNYDENLVYVNQMQIYKPMLVKSGQQDGLSFVNPDLVEKVSFYAGAWQAKYGDRLSSVLDVKYKTPKKFKASASLSLLSFSAHVENRSKNKRLSYAIGVRHKRAQYLLNSLPTKGDYKPRFYDVQGIVNYEFVKEKDRDQESAHYVSLIYSWALNDYRFSPTTRETKFGTATNPKTFTVAYDGKENYVYNAAQVGLTHGIRINSKFKIQTLGSLVKSVEKEYRDVIAYYRLCDTDPNTSNGFNQCLITTGVGTDTKYARNNLEIEVGTIGEKAYIDWNPNNRIETGVTFTFEHMKDKLNEYTVQDSANYIQSSSSVKSNNDLRTHRIEYYIQNNYLSSDSTHFISIGARLNYWSMNNQILVSPRLNYAYKPQWKRDVVFRFGTGLYQQQAFYREYRAFNGQLNRSIQAQRSCHIVAGLDYNLKIWGRPFKLLSEAYYKQIDQVIPYDVDNVQLRYYAVNSGTAYVVGGDIRLSGEFVKGTESWFSLGLLKTQENVDIDQKGYISRPTDQLINIAVFVRDHLPNNPSMQVYLTGSYLTGFPFGLPNDVNFRAQFKSPSYMRVDIGFSKMLLMNDKDIESKKFFESIWLSAEILNLFGNNNTISYDWIKDNTGNHYAIPNTLSTRFLNFKLSVRI